VIEYEIKKPHGGGKDGTIRRSDKADERKPCGETPDPRRQWGYIRHKLLDLLVIGPVSKRNGKAGDV
jgi:hypothetical protein